MNYDETDIAQRYDTARQMPERTMRLWLDSIARYVTPGVHLTVLDVGCGTGRFSAERLDAVVIGVDPSQTMLAKAKNTQPNPRVTFLRGYAERLPVDNRSVGLVYLSMVYHHLGEPAVAAREFRRVLRSNGLLFIRNSTLDLLHTVLYLKYFPEVMAFNRKRVPTQNDILGTMSANGFSSVAHEAIEQQFAPSLGEYCQKISHRALSDLAALTDAEFEAGMRRMKEAVMKDEESGPIIELIDLFIFEKRPNPAVQPIAHTAGSG
jgi:ubiquinone/menaquinone biosynthesis C-methylase UbiE